MQRVEPVHGGPAPFGDEGAPIGRRDSVAHTANVVAGDLVGLDDQPAALHSVVAPVSLSPDRMKSNRAPSGMRVRVGRSAKPNLGSREGAPVRMRGVASRWRAMVLAGLSEFVGGNRVIGESSLFSMAPHDGDARGFGEGGFNWWLQRFSDVGGRCDVGWA